MTKISKEREEEIRKILRANMQKTRQRLRSYSRHTLVLEGEEDSWTEAKLRRQKVEMGRRMSHYLTVPANREDSPLMRRSKFDSDNQVYVSKPSPAVSVPTINVEPVPPADSAEKPVEGPQRTVEGAMRTSSGKGRKLSVTFALDVEEQKLPRCLSDPGPNKIDEEDEERSREWEEV
ncbi:hypothetical protein AOLI_G00189210 [Acnodon oligacanthus]